MDGFSTWICCCSKAEADGKKRTTAVTVPTQVREWELDVECGPTRTGRKETPKNECVDCWMSVPYVLESVNRQYNMGVAQSKTRE